jgi:hypothetical protein
MFTAIIEGLDELETDAKTAASELQADLLEGSFDAAKYGVTSMQDNHPYTDRTWHLTNDMHVDGALNDTGDTEAEIVIPAGYAGFVDEGTSRSRPYPFTPLGEAMAEEALAANTDMAVDTYVAKFGQ